MVKCRLQPSTPLDEMFVEPPTPSTPHVEKMVLDGGESFALKAVKALEALPPYVPPAVEEESPAAARNDGVRRSSS